MPITLEEAQAEMSGEVALTDRWTPLKPHKEQSRFIYHKARFKWTPSGRRSGKCLAKGTMVSMTDGTVRPVELVNAGDMVVTVDGMGLKLESQAVSHVHPNGVKPIIAFHTPGRFLRCTANHPVLANGAWVEAGDLRIGDLVAVPKSLPFFSDVRMPDDDVDFLALWLAEGHDYTVSNQTPAIVDIIHGIANRWGLQPKLYAKCDWYLANSAKGRNPARKFLESFGLWGKTSRTKFIPECVFRLPKDQTARFLNLFMACDGSIYPRSGRDGNQQYTVCVGLANAWMVWQLSALLHKFGIRGSIRHKIHSKCGKDGLPYQSWDFSTSDAGFVETFCDEIGAVGKECNVLAAREGAVASKGSSNSHLLPISYDDFLLRLRYDAVVRAGPFANMKMAVRDAPSDLLNLLNDWRKQTPSRISSHRYKRIREFSDGYFDSLVDGDVAWESVISVSVSGSDDTFDLTVEGNHNFISNGIVTHNTEIAKRDTVTELIVDDGSGIPARQIIGAPTYTRVKDIYFEDLRNLIPKHWVKRIKESTSEIEFKTHWGATIRMVGMNKPQVVEGVPWRKAKFDEMADYPKSCFERHILPALNTEGREGSAWMYGVPDEEGANSTEYEKYFDIGLRYPLNLDHCSFWWPSTDILSADKVAEMAATMDPITFAQEILGQFVRSGNRAFPSFSTALHVNRHYAEYCPFLPIDYSLDFGVRPACSLIAQHFQNQLWILDEINLPDGSTDVSAMAFVERCGQRGYDTHNGLSIYGDAAGRAPSSAVGKSDYEILRDVLRANRLNPRFRNLLANPLIKDTVNAIRVKLGNYRGEITVFIDPRCEGLITELKTAPWPDKLNTFHRLAAFRYLVYALYGNAGGAAGVTGVGRAELTENQQISAKYTR